jgi:hypothetical protein
MASLGRDPPVWGVPGTIASVDRGRPRAGRSHQFRRSRHFIGHCQPRCHQSLIRVSPGQISPPTVRYQVSPALITGLSRTRTLHYRGRRFEPRPRQPSERNSPVPPRSWCVPALTNDNVLYVRRQSTHTRVHLVGSRPPFHRENGKKRIAGLHEGKGLSSYATFAEKAFLRAPSVGASLEPP